MRMAALVLALLLLVPPATAQEPVQATEKCAIEGLVVKATTGQPLKRCVVTVSSLEGRGQPRNTVTDAQGRFALSDVEPGRYQLWCHHDGYLAQGYGGRRPNDLGRPITLDPGQHLRDIVVRLTPTAAIAGRVYDEDGEPVSAANVQAMRYAVLSGGERQLAPAGGSTTNDLGEYRIAGLVPGRYYLSATYALQPTGDFAPEAGYAPVYYPGTNELDAATPVELRPGDDNRDIDFTLLPARTVHVRGHVFNSTTGKSVQGANVSLMRHEPNTQMISYSGAAYVQDASGAFDIGGVPPGSYILMGQLFGNNQQYVGRELLNVGDSDIDGIELAVGPNFEMKGRVSVEGKSKFDLTGLQVFLEPREVITGTQAAPIESDGSFLLKNLFDGTYRVGVWNLPGDYYLKSARLGSEDVLDTDLSISRKQSLEPLELVLSPAGGRIEGVVSNQQKPFAGAQVVLVPDRRSQHRLYSATTAGGDGHFALRGITPGNYHLFAREELEDGAYEDPDLLRQYEDRSKPLRVEEGEVSKIQLELIPAAQTSP